MDLEYPSSGSIPAGTDWAFYRVVASTVSAMYSNIVRNSLCLPPEVVGDAGARAGHHVGHRRRSEVLVANTAIVASRICR